MTSIYQRALREEFARLHPEIQRRFGFSSCDGIASVGHGVMEEIWRGPLYTLPFLYIGTWRRIMFPEQGRDVPFTIENYAYRDSYGRETLTWVRTFHLGGSGGRQRRFDATMIYSEQRARIVDYLGSHQHLAVDIDLAVDEKTRGLCLRSGAQRFYEGVVGFPFPMVLSGYADVCEWFDEATLKFRIEVDVRNRLWGRLFGYRGWFDVEWRRCGPDQIPAHVKPLREERRE
jgi:hypothetical protein